MRKKIFLTLIGLIFMLLVGCASAPVKLQPVAGEVDLGKYDTLVVEVFKADGVQMSDGDLQRMQKLIIEATEKCHQPRLRVTAHRNQPGNNDNNELILRAQFIKFNTAIGTPAFVPLRYAHIIGEISIERPQETIQKTILFNGTIQSKGSPGLWGGDIPPGVEGWKALFSVQAWTERKFAEKVAKSLIF